MRIGIDFDEVVADSLEAIIRLHNRHFGTTYKKEEVTHYNLEEEYGGTREEWKEKLDEFFSARHVQDLNPMAGSIPAITALKAMGHELYIITARSDDGVEATELWLKLHFPDVFHGVHYANFLASDPKKKQKKSEICRANGIEVMIDDNLGTAMECATAGIKVLLFDYPWNQGELPPNVERVFSWDDILAALGGGAR